MLDQMAHRGPDGQHREQLGEVTFAHAHLHSTPQSESETLPFIDSNSRTLVTADARLDDRKHLLSNLGLPITDPYLIGDGQLILRAYLKWGTDCPKHLKGDFAFAIWDDRTGTFFAARDHFGIKPFVYYKNNDLLAFASQPKAILACPFVPRSINQPRIADFFISYLEGVDYTSTFFEDIHRLPPGHSLTVIAGKVAVQRYWKLEPSAQLKLSCDAEYGEAFSEVFSRAVHRRLQSNNTAGAMLSGGIDSGSIVAIARLHNKHSNLAPLKTYSAILTGPEAEGTDESSCIQMVIDQGDIDAYTTTPDAFDDQIESYESAASRSDNPFDDAPLTERVFQKASQQGDKSILTGADGDLTTSISSRYLYYLLREGKIFQAIKESYRVGHLYSDYHWACSVLRDCLLPAYLPGHIWRSLRLGRITARQNNYISESNLVDEFAAASCVRERITQMYDYDLPEEEYRTMMERQAHILMAPWVTAGLERYESTAAKFGLECRHPFFDLDLVNFCLTLPWQQKTRAGWPKWILRQSIGSRLPRSVAWRKSSDDNHESFNRKTFQNRVKSMSREKHNYIGQILKKYLSGPRNGFQWDDAEVFLAAWLDQNDPSLQ
jgi:asparagine synthase (glutamine-hydrolysing)